MTREELNQEKQKEVMSETRYENRKKIVLFVFKVILIIVVLFISFYLYTSLVSTKILSVREYRIINKKVPTDFNGLKVVQFSDLHYGTTIFIKDLKNVVKKINESSPDLVVFTGDLIDKSYKLSTKEQEKIIQELDKIETSLGKYAVRGEEDSNSFSTIMNQSGFNILDNNYDFIYNESDKPLLMVGIDSQLQDRSDLKKAYDYFNDPKHNVNIFTISLVHEPDVTNDIMTWNADYDGFLKALFSSVHGA